MSRGLCLSALTAHVPLLSLLSLLSLLLLLQDVLGHPHTKAFVSHCGVHSVNEAAFHGVPVVGVPIQFEQVGSGYREHVCEGFRVDGT
jgi:hypothetical protein